MEPSEAALRVDRELQEIERAYDPLELLRPTNVEEAWEDFRSGGFETEPEFEYSEIEVDPGALRTRLEDLDMSGIEDSSLLYFLMAKRNELVLELQLLDTRNTPAFLAGSICLYGPVQQELLGEAKQVLKELKADEEQGPAETLTSDEVRELVDEELELPVVRQQLLRRGAGPIRSQRVHGRGRGPDLSGGHPASGAARPRSGAA